MAWPLLTGSLGFGAYEDELVSRAWTARRSSHTPRTRHGGARRSLTVNPWPAEITHKVGPSTGLFTNSHKTDKKMHPTGQYQTGLANAAAMHVINATRTRQAISIITVHHMQHPGQAPSRREHRAGPGARTMARSASMVLIFRVPPRER
jgi:hypothetical protein